MRLVTNPYAYLDDRADREIPTATLQIYDHIAQSLMREDSTHVNRASSASLCPRRRWFQRTGVKGTPLNPRKIINFTLGDLTERVVLAFIRDGLVGPGKLYSEIHLGEKIGEIKLQGKLLDVHAQEDLVIQEKGMPEVTAHADGWGKRNLDGKWELIEIKSAADYGFSGFQQEGPKDYIKQAHALMMTTKAKELGVRETRFFFLRKSTGHIHDRLEVFDEKIWRQVRREYIQVLSDDCPPAPYKLKEDKDGRTVAPFPCAGYCPYTKECHGDFDVEWKKDHFGHYRPSYVFKTKEKPSVPTTTNDW